jgi:hypothetical protein
VCVDEKRFAAFSLVVGCPRDQLHLKMDKQSCQRGLSVNSIYSFIYRQYDTCFIIHIRASMINTIQGDSEGKVNILGSDSIGHCEKKNSYENVSNSEWLPR